MKSFISVLAISAGVLFHSNAHAEMKESWGYEGPHGPAHWGELDTEYASCSGGKNQSPINLEKFIESDLEQLEFSYSAHAREILNNGNTIEVNFPPDSSFSIAGRKFDLEQFHFHAPSEHSLDGRKFAMEAHFVHADADGNLAVIGVMLELGEPNQTVAALWQQLPEQVGDKHHLNTPVNAESLLPANRAYFRYNGSLTTPPCTEGVLWLIMKDSVPVSQAQVDAFKRALHHPNNRPLQPANARPVLK